MLRLRGEWRAIDSEDENSYVLRYNNWLVKVGSTKI